LSEEDQAGIINWLQQDEDFREQFSSWFGDDQYQIEFDFLED
jgi:hypothetical protein